MKIHCICIVRDEADIIGHTLDAALEWADGIYVCDNGSTDGTWELLQEYASSHRRLVLVDREHGPFAARLRNRIAARFSDRLRKGDWWCRLDADELYVDNPRDFLAGIRPRDQLVFSASIQYYFTDLDLAAFERDPDGYVERWTPELLRYYLVNWSELRFVRHTPGLDWTYGWPVKVKSMRSSPERIRLRHYQYRSPPQIERRLRTRMNQTEEGAFLHEKTSEWIPMGVGRHDLVFPGPPELDEELWRSRVVRTTPLHRDDGDGQFRIDPELLPPGWIRPSLWKRTVERVRNLV